MTIRQRFDAWRARRRMRRMCRDYVRGVITERQRTVEMWNSLADIDLETAYADYAAALVKSTERLTFEEKKQAMLKGILKG